MFQSTLTRVFLRSAQRRGSSAAAQPTTIKQKLNKKQFAQLRRVFEELTADRQLDAAASLDVTMFKRICAKVIGKN